MRNRTLRRGLQRVGLLLVLLSSGLAVPSAAPGGLADGTGERARSADAFVNSIGVVTHLHYDDTAYARYDDVIRPRLVESGIRHVADYAYTYPGVSGEGFYYRRLRDLGRRGVRFSLGTSIDTAHSDRTNIGLLDDVQRWTGGAVEMFSGANEPDISGVSDWAARARSLQRDVWTKVRDDVTLAGVKVAGPSPVWQPGELGDISAWADYGSWHPYPGGLCPTCADAYGTSLDSLIDTYRAPTGSKPLVATETGYHDAVVGVQDHRPVSEQAAGRYVPRLLLEYFNRGIARSYLYELIDLRSDPNLTDRDEHFGLLRSDGSRKPAFTAVRNLISVLEDPGSAFTPTRLDYTVSGETSRVHRTLLQKRDGRFYLALWQERPSYDTGQRANRPDDIAARRDLDVTPQRVRVSTAQPFATARLFTPGQHNAAVKTWTGATSLTVDVPDEVIVVELTPATVRVPIADPLPGPGTDPPARIPTGACWDVPRSVFRDVAPAHVFAVEIDCLAHWRMTRGTGSGRRYEPQHAVQRWQMAVFLDRLAGIEGVAGVRDGRGFDDTSRLSNEARGAVARLRGLGVVEGTTATAFAPYRQVTRAQIAAFLNRLRTISAPATHAPDVFNDDDRSVHERDINMLAAEGIVNGVGAGRYRPGASVNRGQMAAMLVRYLQYLLDSDRDITPG